MRQVSKRKNKERFFMREQREMERRKKREKKRFKRQAKKQLEESRHAAS